MSRFLGLEFYSLIEAPAPGQGFSLSALSYSENTHVILPSKKIAQWSGPVGRTVIMPLARRWDLTREGRGGLRSFAEKNLS
jgi:hypothetical protein